MFEPISTEIILFCRQTNITKSNSKPQFYNGSYFVVQTPFESQTTNPQKILSF